MSLMHDAPANFALPQAPAVTNFRLPGPTPVPPEVAAAGSWPMVNHRGPEFAAIITRVTERLQHFFKTQNNVLVFPGSGSAGWEASIANLFSAGDQVAIVSIGNFGDRFAIVANAFGLQVEKIDFAWGQAADPAVVAERIRGIKNLRGVFFTHNETSTGVTNDIVALSKAIHEAAPDALVVVDAVSSMGCVDAPTDELGIDVIFTGSQKGWMCPPGLMMVAVGPRAREASKTATLPRFFFDFERAITSFAKNNPPYTAPISLWYQLDVALALMMQEGREAVFARHQSLGEFTRQGALKLGLTLFAEPAHASNTVTAINSPEGIDAKAFLKTLRTEDHVIFAGGQGKLEGKIFRVGHMGAAYQDDIAQALAAIERRMQG